MDAARVIVPSYTPLVSITTRTTPRQARSTRSVGLILSAAERMFHERGVSETSTVDIASAARVSVGRLYYWFPDKDAVIDAMVGRAHERAIELVAARARAGHDGSVRSLVRDSCELLGQFSLEHPGTLTVLQRHDPVSAGPAALRLRRGFTEMVGTLMRVAEPDVDDARVEAVAATVARITLAFGLDHARAEPVDRAPILDDLAYLLLAYLRRSLGDGRSVDAALHDDPLLSPRSPA